MCVCCGSSRGGGGAGPVCSWLPAKGVDVARVVPQPLLVAPSNRGSQLASVGPSMQAVCGSRQGPLLRCVVRCAALAHLLKSLCSLCHCLWGCRHGQWILVAFGVPCIQAVALLVDWARVFGLVGNSLLLLSGRLRAWWWCVLTLLLSFGVVACTVVVYLLRRCSCCRHCCRCCCFAPLACSCSSCPWTVALGVLQYTHLDHIACRECIVIAPVSLCRA
jgi:hypothetical protein